MPDVEITNKATGETRTVSFNNTPSQADIEEADAQVWGKPAKAVPAAPVAPVQAQAAPVPAARQTPLPVPHPSPIPALIDPTQQPGFVQHDVPRVPAVAGMSFVGGLKNAAHDIIPTLSGLLTGGRGVGESLGKDLAGNINIARGFLTRDSMLQAQGEAQKATSTNEFRQAVGGLVPFGSMIKGDFDAARGKRSLESVGEQGLNDAYNNPVQTAAQFAFLLHMGVSPFMRGAIPDVGSVDPRLMEIERQRQGGADAMAQGRLEGTLGSSVMLADRFAPGNTVKAAGFDAPATVVGRDVKGGTVDIQPAGTTQVYRAPEGDVQLASVGGGQPLTVGTDEGIPAKTGDVVKLHNDPRPVTITGRDENGLTGTLPGDATPYRIEAKAIESVVPKAAPVAPVEPPTSSVAPVPAEPAAPVADPAVAKKQRFVNLKGDERLPIYATAELIKDYEDRLTGDNPHKWATNHLQGISGRDIGINQLSDSKEGHIVLHSTDPQTPDYPIHFRYEQNPESRNYYQNLNETTLESFKGATGKIYMDVARPDYTPGKAFRPEITDPGYERQNYDFRGIAAPTPATLPVSLPATETPSTPAISPQETPKPAAATIAPAPEKAAPQADSTPKPGPNMAGSINLDKIDVSPEAKAGITEAVNAAGLADKPSVSHETRTENAKNLGVTADSLRAMEPGTFPANADSVDFLVAVRDLNAKHALDAAVADKAYQANRTPENLAAVQTTTANRLLTIQHTDALSATSGKLLEAHKITALPERALVPSIAEMFNPVTQKATFGDKGFTEGNTLVPKMEADAARARVTEERLPSLPKPRKISANNYGTANTIFTKDSYKLALANIGKASTRLSAGVDPSLLPDLVTVGGYHFEAGLRSFGDWAAQMRTDMGAHLSDGDLQNIWSNVRTEMQSERRQNSNAGNISRTGEIFADALARKLGREPANNVIDTLHTPTADGSATLFEKLLKGTPLTDAETSSVLSAYRENQARPAGRNAPPSGPLAPLTQIIRDSNAEAAASRLRGNRQSAPVSPQDAFVRRVTGTLGKDGINSFQTSVGADTFGRLSRGETLSPEERQAVGQAWNDNKPQRAAAAEPSAASKQLSGIVTENTPPRVFTEADRAKARLIRQAVGEAKAAANSERANALLKGKPNPDLVTIGAAHVEAGARGFTTWKRSVSNDPAFAGIGDAGYGRIWKEIRPELTKRAETLAAPKEQARDLLLKGIRKGDPKMSDKVTQIATDLAQVKDGDTRGILKVINAHSKASAGEWARQVQQGNFLAGPVQMAQIVLSHGLFNATEDMLTRPIAHVLSRGAEPPPVRLGTMGWRIGAMVDAAKDIPTILKEGDNGLTLRGRGRPDAPLSPEPNIGPFAYPRRAHGAYFHVVEAGLKVQGALDEMHRIGHEEAAASGLSGAARKNHITKVIADQQANPSERVLEAANRYSEEQLLMNKNAVTEFIHGGQQKVEKYKPGGGDVAKLMRAQVAPFISVPSNFAMRSYEQHFGALHQGMAQAIATVKLKQGMGMPMTPAERSLATRMTARNMGGVVMMATGYGIAQALKNANKRDVVDKYSTVHAGPLNINLTRSLPSVVTGMGLHELAEKRKAGILKWNDALKLPIETVQDMPGVRGSEDISTLSKDPYKYWKNFVVGAIPGAIPLREAARLVDPQQKQRANDTITHAVLRGLPYLSKKVPLRGGKGGGSGGLGNLGNLGSLGSLGKLK